MRIAISIVIASLGLACGESAEAPPVETPAARAKTPDADATKGATHRIVDLPVGGDLPKVLAEHAALAKQAKLTPFVELWAEWCPPCKALEAAMGDARIVK